MKTRKSLWRILIATTLEAEEAVVELLAVVSRCVPSTYFDVEKHSSVVSCFSTKPVPRHVRPELRAGLDRIRGCGLDIGAGMISIGRLRAQDWAESWKRHFKPITIGDSLLIKPSWSKLRPRRGQALVVLDPGLSFGTGQHPTTSFCLEQLVTAVVRRSPYAKSAALFREAATKSLLDIGTGSGILAIAAAKLGYGRVDAFDFDPDAVRIAKGNAATNGVRIKISRADITRLPLRADRRYDVVCANLISNLLIAERKKIANRLNRNGLLVLAGILKDEFPIVKKAFEQVGLRLVAARAEKEWMSGSFTH